MCPVCGLSFITRKVCSLSDIGKRRLWILQLQQQLKVVNSLLDVLCPVLVPVTTHVFNRVALAEVELVSLDELNGLNSEVLVVTPADLLL